MGILTDRSRGVLLVAGFLLFLALLLLVVPAWRESQTADEAVYLSSGLSYWRTGDFRLNVEHPPLVKLFLALPLLAEGVRFAPETADWEGAGQWDVAPKTLYENVLPAQRLLFEGRLANIFLTLVLLVVASAWAGRTWGRSAGLFVLALIVFEPNILAHGHLATTDVGYALGILASLYTFGRYLEQRIVGRFVTASLVTGLALLTRFNAVILFLILPIQYLVVELQRGTLSRIPWRRVAVRASLFALMVLLTVWALYGFEVRTLTEPQDDAARRVLDDLGGTWLQRVPLPAASFVSGALWQFEHTAQGQPAYLFGRTSDRGWWFYFPVALLVKMTLVSLGLVLAGMVVSLRRRGLVASTSVFTPLFMLAPIFILGTSALLSRLNLGVRYVLPVIVLVVMFTGAIVPTVKRRATAAVLIVLVFLHAISVLRFFPHFLPYANEAFGGPKQLPRFLIDSNLDWGQDLPLLKSYLDRNGLEEYRLKSFTTTPALAYGLSDKPVPTDDEVTEKPFRGVVAIGISALNYPGARYEWLKRLEPTAVLGYSINVYDLRN